MFYLANLSQLIVGFQHTIFLVALPDVGMQIANIRVVHGIPTCDLGKKRSGVSCIGMEVQSMKNKAKKLFFVNSAVGFEILCTYE